MRAHRWWLAVVSAAIGLWQGGCAHSSGPVLTPLGRDHVRSAYRGKLEGTAVVLPVLDCTSTEVLRIPNPNARAAAEQVANDLWQRLGLPGAPDLADADALPERARLCRELSDNLDSGTNYVSASPAMRELLRDYFNRHGGRSWLMVAARWIWLGDRVPGTSPGVGVLEGKRHETDFLDASLYLFSRDGDVAYRADLFCRDRRAGRRHDCGAPVFDRIPDRVAELVEGFPRQLLVTPAVVRTGGLIPMQRPPDPVIDIKNPGAVKLPDYNAPLRPLAPSPPASGGGHSPPTQSTEIKKLLAHDVETLPVSTGAG